VTETEILAHKLAEVTAALVAADQALERRVEGVERLFLDRYADIERDGQGVVQLLAGGAEQARSRGRVRRMFQRSPKERPYEGSGPKRAE
jgi:hypothetical protein